MPLLYDVPQNSWQGNSFVMPPLPANWQRSPRRRPSAFEQLPPAPDFSQVPISAASVAAAQAANRNLSGTAPTPGEGDLSQDAFQNNQPSWGGMPQYEREFGQNQSGDTGWEGEAQRGGRLTRVGDKIVGGIRHALDNPFATAANLAISQTLPGAILNAVPWVANNVFGQNWRSPGEVLMEEIRNRTGYGQPAPQQAPTPIAPPMTFDAQIPSFETYDKNGYINNGLEMPPLRFVADDLPTVNQLQRNYEASSPMFTNPMTGQPWDARTPLENAPQIEMPNFPHVMDNTLDGEQSSYGQGDGTANYGESVGSGGNYGYTGSDDLPNNYLHKGGMVHGRIAGKVEDVPITAQEGEGVLSRKAMARYPGLLAAANKGALGKRFKGILSR